MTHFHIIPLVKGESRNEHDRRYNTLRGRYLIRAKRLGKRKCAFCGILLASPLVKMRCKKYCDKCRNDPETQRYMRALYQNRFYNKKRGNSVPTLTMAEP